MTSPSVDVCVVTYRRARLLERALASLAQQVTEARARVIVVDNDCTESARPIVERFQAAAGTEVAYIVEPKRGIAAARNCALDRVDSEFLAFLDDDETAQPGWLQSLVGAAERFRADAVFGPVLPKFPDGAPGWANKHPAFARPRLLTGAPVKFGGSGNVLIRTVALGLPRQLFDDSYGITGGEDTEFFYRLHLVGKRLVWCDEAEVFEQVPAGRLTVEWVRQRSYRNGQSFCRAVVSRQAWPRRCGWFVRKLVQFCAASAVVPVLRYTHDSAFVRASSAAARAAGHLVASVGGGLATFDNSEYGPPTS